METASSLQCSQDLAIGPYSESHYPVYICSSYFPRFILILSPHLRLGHRSGQFLSGLRTKNLYAHIMSSARAICPSHLILLDVISLIFGEAYNLWSSLFCRLLQPPTTPSLSLSLTTKYSLQHSVSQTLSIYMLPSAWETKFHTNTNQQVKL